MGQPDEALAKVVAGSRGVLTEFVPRRGNDGCASVPVGHQMSIDHPAQGKVRLHPGPAEPAAQSRIAGRQQQANARCHGDTRFPIANELIAVIEGKIAHAATRARCGIIDRGHGVAELVGYIGAPAIPG